MIPAVVHDQAAFAGLGRVVARELPKTKAAHIKEVNVADLAVALLIDIFTRLANPGGVTDPGVIADSFDDDPAGAFQFGFIIDGKLDFLAGAVRRTALTQGAWIDLLPGWVRGADVEAWASESPELLLPGTREIAWKLRHSTPNKMKNSNNREKFVIITL